MSVEADLPACARAVGDALRGGVPVVELLVEPAAAALRESRVEYRAAAADDRDAPGTTPPFENTDVRPPERADTTTSP